MHTQLQHALRVALLSVHRRVQTESGNKHHGSLAMDGYQGTSIGRKTRLVHYLVCMAFLRIDAPAISELHWGPPCNPAAWVCLASSAPCL